jgi:hypothetical protein
LVAAISRPGEVSEEEYFSQKYENSIYVSSISEKIGHENRYDEHENVRGKMKQRPWENYLIKAF